MSGPGSVTFGNLSTGLDTTASLSVYDLAYVLRHDGTDDSALTTVDDIARTVNPDARRGQALRRMTNWQWGTVQLSRIHHQDDLAECGAQGFSAVGQLLDACDSACRRR